MVETVQRVGRDAFVVGHRAVYMPKSPLPMIRGQICEAAPTRVVFEVGSALGMFGIPKRTTWTWRDGRGWFQKGTRPHKGERGLMLLRSA